MNFSTFNESERSLSVRFADDPSPALSQQIQAVGQQLRTVLGSQLVDLTPSFNTLLVTFDPFTTSHEAINKAVTTLLSSDTIQASHTQTKEHVLPVFYDFSDQWDLLSVAGKLALTPEQLIEQHQAHSYQVYAIGFAPGFAYLGDLPESLRLPRLTTPRTHVPAGAVAIAEQMTAVYPQVSPGGWHILGHCPSVLFDMAREPACSFQVGDTVRFEAIDKKTYQGLRGQQ